MRVALTFGIAALVTLGGCVTPNNALDSYIGQDIHLVVERIGEPTVEEDMLGQTRYSWSRGYGYPSAAGANTGFGSVFGEGDAYMTTQKSPSFGSGTGMAEHANRAQRTRERGSTRTVHWCTIEIAADRNQKVTQWWLAEHSTPSVCTPYFQALAQ